MRLPQQHLAVLGAQAGQFVSQGLVVGLPVGVHPAGHLGVVGLGVGVVERLAMEGLGGTQAGGGLARVEAFAAGGAVQVDHVA